MGGTSLEPAATYSVHEVASLSGLTASRIRSLARAGVIDPQPGPRGELRLRFRDLAFLRRVRDLASGRVTPRRVTRALERLREELPADRHLAELGLSTAAGQVVVRDGSRLWSPESGQCVFDFDSRASGERPRVVEIAPRGAFAAEQCSEHWYALGCELEASEPDRAREAYQRAIELDPTCTDAHVNLGCLDHAADRLADAESHYRAALAVREDATARFDLAVVLEDQGRDEEAREAYEACLAADPTCAEAHYNLARLCESAGDEPGTLRHLLACRRLSRDEGSDD